MDELTGWDLVAALVRRERDAAAKAVPEAKYMSEAVSAMCQIARRHGHYYEGRPDEEAAKLERARAHLARLEEALRLIEGR